jgi:general secretion pathway protein L
MMITLSAIADGFNRWIDLVAGTVVALFERFATPPTVRIVEKDRGEFLLEAGKKVPGSDLVAGAVGIVEGGLNPVVSSALAASMSGNRVELVLQADRFLFRPLELPQRATEFLGGIVRAQIDRLTPWNAADAAVGWSKPVEAGADRVTITVAATALDLLRPYVRAVAASGAHSIAVFTNPPDCGAGATPVKVWEERARGAVDIGRVRRALVVILAASGIAAGAALGATALIRASLIAQQDELARQIASTRSAVGAAREAARGSVAATQLSLEQRKHEAPSTVIVLDTLSQILPDHTYVTELRVEGNKLRLSGITRDAPSLIGLIERSGRFVRATFFAPTTRSRSEPGERFHIEAVIQPLASPPA